MPILSARILICSALSSPDMYKIRNPLQRNAICNINVDFPMPGSPPTNINEPATNPPPKTLSNSMLPVAILALPAFSMC
jgi:hypothetical protein